MRAGAAVALLCLWSAALQGQSALSRRVSLPTQPQVTLRAALDTVASRAQIHLSYSAEALPLTRQVALEGGSTTVGAALRALLAGLPVAVVAIADDHVVLSPRAQASAEPAAAILAEVNVTEDDLARRTVPATVAVDVLTGEALARRNESSIRQVLSSSLPGIWLWEQTPSALVSQYGSVRGSSSFGSSHPKVYLDGVELANPMFLTHIAPELVDRIEVTRGPHGAAIHGADAMSGVVHIFSRHQGADGAGRALLQSDLGWTQSAFGAAAPVQRHALSYRTGAGLRSAGVSIRGATSGNYVPNAYAREIQAMGDFRSVGSATSVSVTARVQGKEAGVPSNPLLATVSSAIGADRGPQALGLYSFGTTVRRSTSDATTHSFSAGVDGYRLSNVHLDAMPFPSAADSALRSASGGADRFMLRMSSERQSAITPWLDARLMLGAEQTLLRDHSLSDGVVFDDSSAALFRRLEWSTNAGVLASGELSLGHRLFLTGASRLERIRSDRYPAIVVLLPHVGIAARHGFSGVSTNVRTSYGRGIRAPNMHARAAPLAVGSNFTTPESQTGLEAGVDLAFGRAATLHLTHFHQVASALEQSAAEPNASSCVESCRAEVTGGWFVDPPPVTGGAIRNRGWEARGSVSVRRLVLAGATTLTDSRVIRTAKGYNGELRVGDRTLGVPSRTGSFTAEWLEPRWSTAWTVSRASDWVNYDRLGLAAVLDSPTSRDGANELNPRDFWMTYAGTTRLRGTFLVQLPRNMAMQVTGENLTDEQLGAPDNVTILPGRSVTVGLKTRF